MPVAVPLVMAAVSYAGSRAAKHAAEKTQKQAQQRTPMEQAALASQQGIASGLAGTGQELTKSGQETTQTGLNTMAPAATYFGSLLRGNRALQSQAVAGARGGITDTYRGAERSLEKSGVRGASRDVASGELARQKAGQISSLITGVQPNAAQALAGIGSTQAGIGATQTGQGIGATTSASSIYGNITGREEGNRQGAFALGQQEGDRVGNAFGQFAAGIGSYYGGGTGGNSGIMGGRRLPSRPAWSMQPVTAQQTPGRNPIWGS